MTPKDSIPAEATGQRRVCRLREGAFAEADDCLVVEEPLEIRLENRPFTVTMRTPGDDLDLARGLLLTEGVIRSEADIGRIRHCDDATEDAANIVAVLLRENVPALPWGWQRELMAGVSCGLCGKTTIEAVRGAAPPVRNNGTFSRDTLLRLPHTLRRRQALFQRTGGLHAAGIFDGAGACRALFEDIGRHNAADKAIGQGVREGWLPWTSTSEPLALLISGRASFEIVQKAAMAGIPVVCAVSAASTLAVDLAAAGDQTLIGFLRDTGMTIYTGAHRVQEGENKCDGLDD
jgi:FdhD protein